MLNPSRRDNKLCSKRRRCQFCGMKHQNSSEIQKRHDSYL